MAKQKIKINKRYNDHKLIRKFFPIRYLSLSANEYGELSASSITGRLGMTSLLIPTPNYDCYFNDYEATGGTINGDTYTFGDMDGTAKANFNRNIHHVILETAFGGTISADKTSGYHNDIVTLSTEQTGDIAFQFFSANGAEITGDQFAFQTTDVTAKAIYCFPVTYLADEHVHLTGDDLYIPGSEGITLQSSYDTYYRISGYDIINGSIVDGKLVPTGPCTIKAVQKVNTFTASGNYLIPNGSDQYYWYGPTATANFSYFYATANYATQDISNYLVNVTSKVNGQYKGYVVNATATSESGFDTTNIGMLSYTSKPIVQWNISYSVTGQKYYLQLFNNNNKIDEITSTNGGTKTGRMTLSTNFIKNNNGIYCYKFGASTMFNGWWDFNGSWTATGALP